MSDRLTDDKVAMYVDMGNYPATSCVNDDVIALAREVQEYRALRPTCPTCEGAEWDAGPTAGGAAMNANLSNHLRKNLLYAAIIVAAVLLVVGVS